MNCIFYLSRSQLISGTVWGLGMIGSGFAFGDGSSDTPSTGARSPAFGPTAGSSRATPEGTATGRICPWPGASPTTGAGGMVSTSTMDGGK